MPWKPVARKKVLPYTPSEMENCASLYSTHCIIKKYTPKRTVIRRLKNDLAKKLFTMEW